MLIYRAEGLSGLGPFNSDSVVYRLYDAMEDCGLPGYWEDYYNFPGLGGDTFTPRVERVDPDLVVGTRSPEEFHSWFPPCAIRFLAAQYFCCFVYEADEVFIGRRQVLFYRSRARVVDVRSLYAI